MEHHNFNMNVGHWPYCSKCGLVRLRNPFTEWAVSKGCDYKEHPAYDRQRSQTNPLEKRRENL